MRILLLAILVSLTLVGCRTVQPPPDTVTVTLEEGHAEFVQFVAYQDGAGDWTELTPHDGEYRFEVTDRGGRYGVAVVCYFTYDVPGREPYLEPLVIHATTDEASALSLPCVEAVYASPERNSVLTGSVINVPAEIDSLAVDGAMQGRHATRPGSFEFTLSPVADGVHDVIASVQTERYVVTRLAIARDAIVDGTGHATIDWDESVEPAPFDLTIRGLTPGHSVGLESGLITKNDAWAGFTDAHTVAATSAYATTYNAVPASFLAEGDMQMLYVGSTDASGQTRAAARYFVEGEDREVALPEGSLDLEAVVASGPYARHALMWSDVGATLINAYVGYDTDELATGWEAVLTPGWMTEHAYTVPDLSGLDGWEPAWNTAEADITGTFIFLGADFEPTERALRSFLTWPAPQEGEWSYITAVLDY